MCVDCLGKSQFGKHSPSATKVANYVNPYGESVSTEVIASRTAPINEKYSPKHKKKDNK